MADDPVICFFDGLALPADRENEMARIVGILSKSARAADIACYDSCCDVVGRKGLSSDDRLRMLATIFEKLLDSFEPEH
jgi:hypothetical protein